MFEDIENLKPVSVILGIGSVFKDYKDRESHALVFKLNGATKYTFPDKTLIHNENELIFIPKGASYRVELLRGAPSYYLLINFDGEIQKAYPEVYALDNVTDTAYLRSRIDKLRGVSSLSDKFRCNALIYEIFALMSESENSLYRTADTYNLIEPAVKYLNENLFDSNLKIGELHLKTKISDTYFRKIFISRFGVSPKRYVINKRLSQAKAIIDNGDFGSIAEVALLCGFEDPLYFGKVYKNKYGRPPSKNL